MIDLFLGTVSIVLAAQSAPSIAIDGPPSLPDVDAVEEDPYSKCDCTSEDSEKVEAEFTGLVADAELFLGKDGKSIADEQATIFTVIDGLDEERVKVFHSTKPEKCGVTFGYGKQYEVSVTKIGEKYRTSYCIDPRRYLSAP